MYREKCSDAGNGPVSKWLYRKTSLTLVLNGKPSNSLS